jgi:hypothetical protein
VAADGGAPRPGRKGGFVSHPVDPRFAHLFQPGRIGKLEVANRIKYAAC